MNAKEKKILQNLGKQIKNKREELKISQVELSKKTGIDRSYISMIERGETNLSYLKLVSILEILKVKIFLK